MILPRTAAPNLSFPLLAGGQWSLADQTPDAFTMILAFRGSFCSICKIQLEALNAKLDEFTSRGVNVVVVSADDAAHARKMQTEWDIDKLLIGYGLRLEDAREWRLYVSSGYGETPPVFSEPGLFLVRPDGELFYAATQNAPFGRPSLDEMLMAIDYSIKTNYAARGDMPA